MNDLMPVVITPTVLLPLYLGVCVRILFNMNEAFDKLIWSFCFVSTQNFLVNGVTILVANQRPQIFKNILLRFGDGNLISQGLDELWTVYFVFFFLMWFFYKFFKGHSELQARILWRNSFKETLICLKCWFLNKLFQRTWGATNVDFLRKLFQRNWEEMKMDF